MAAQKAAYGNILTITDNANTDLKKSSTYTYDDLNRLLSATVSYTNHPDKNYTQTFTYDSIGNMITNSDLGTLNYNNGQPHQLSSYGTRTFTYDLAGNMRANKVTKFSWDYRNRLTNSFDIASEDYTYYKYDHNNQRFLKWTEEYVFIPDDPQEPYEPEQMRSSVGLEEEILLDGLNGHWEWQVTNQDKYVDKYFEKNLNNQTKSHIFLNDVKLATINNNDNPYYIISDHLNSSNLLTTSSGAIAEVEDYKPYGTTNYQNTIQDLKDDYSYTGKEADEENNLQYFGARYLDNEIGKFISIDPLMIDILDAKKYNKDTVGILANPQALNSYAYAKNNPIVYVDPDGTTEWWALFLPGTYSQLSLWHGVANTLDTANRDISANFLRHSLSVEPGNLVINQNNDNSGVIDSIKGSSEYKSYVNQWIKTAEDNGLTSFDRVGDNTSINGSSLEFNSGDLKTSFHGTYSTHISGQKDDSGSWNLQVNIVDYYDYDWGDTYQSQYKNNFSPLNIGAKSAAASQAQGVISNYFIDVSFSDRINN